MAKHPELNGGLPRSWLEPHENRINLQTRYGNFAISILSELKHSDPSIPMDILTIGDNWYQLVETRENPKDSMEIKLATLGHAKFGDMWPILQRTEQIDLPDLLHALIEGVHARSLNQRILNKLAVFDRASPANPIFDPNQTVTLTTRDWGKIFTVSGFPMHVYYITGGYSRKNPQDIGGTQPGDSPSGAILWNE